MYTNSVFRVLCKRCAEKCHRFRNICQCIMSVTDKCLDKRDLTTAWPAEVLGAVGGWLRGEGGVIDHTGRRPPARDPRAGSALDLPVTWSQRDAMAPL